MTRKTTWEKRLSAPMAEYSRQEAIRLRDEEGWSWRRLGVHFGMPEAMVRAQVAPHCKEGPQLPLGMTEEEVRAGYEVYKQFPNVAVLAEQLGHYRHSWLRAFAALGLPRLKTVRRQQRGKQGVITLDAPRCMRCGILLSEVRHRDGMCVECILEEAGRRDLALDARGYLLTKGILPPMPEEDVDELLAQIGAGCEQVAEVPEVRELTLEMA